MTAEELRDYLINSFDIARQEGMLHSKDGKHSESSESEARDIMDLLREEIEKKRKANPYKTGTLDAREAFDEACQSILSLLEVKEG